MQEGERRQGREGREREAGKIDKERNLGASACATLGARVALLSPRFCRAAALAARGISRWVAEEAALVDAGRCCVESANDEPLALDSAADIAE